MRIGVVTFPGSLDDGDAARAARIAGAEAVRLWHGDPDLHGGREGEDGEEQRHCARSVKECSRESQLPSVPSPPETVPYAR